MDGEQADTNGARSAPDPSTVLDGTVGARQLAERAESLGRGGCNQCQELLTRFAQTGSLDLVMTGLAAHLRQAHTTG